MICRLLYIQKREKLTVDGNQVIVSVEDIQTEYQKLNLAKRLDRATLEEAMRTLKTYNLAKPLDSLNDISARIEIFPSVVMALPDNVLKASQEETERALQRYVRNQEETK